MTAALKADELAIPTKPLGKKVTTNGTEAGQDKRTALRDVTNVKEADGAEKDKGGKTAMTKTPANRVKKNTTQSRKAPSATVPGNASMTPEGVVVKPDPVAPKTMRNLDYISYPRLGDARPPHRLAHRVPCHVQPPPRNPLPRGQHHRPFLHPEGHPGPPPPTRRPHGDVHRDKYEENLTPHAWNFAHVTAGMYAMQDILNTERFILGTLGYDLSYPNPFDFLRRISKADDYDLESRTMAKYLPELTLVDHRFMSFRPSHVAAAAMYLTRVSLGRGEWDPTLKYYAGYSRIEIEPVVQLMVDYLACPIVHGAFLNKWSENITTSRMMPAWARGATHLLGIYDINVSIYKLKLKRFCRA